MKEKRKRETGGWNRVWVKKGAAVLAWVLAVILCMGCGAAGDKTSLDSGGVGSSTMNMDVSGESGGEMYPIGSGSADYSEGNKTLGSGAQTGGQGVSAGWKLITTVNMDVETRQFDEAVSGLETRIAELGGYIENMDTYNGSRYSSSGSSRHSDMTVRIPQGRLTEFLTAVSGVSNVIRRSENVVDVTLSYADMESRRNVLRTEQSRLLEFLDRAETVEEIISLEERLSEVQYQLESMESKLRTLDNKVDFATVNLNISEVQELTPVAEPDLGERISQGFIGSLRNIRDGAAELLVWFVISSPYLLIWALLAGAVLLVIWVQRRKRRNRKTPEGGVVPPPMMRGNVWQGGQGFPPQGMQPGQPQGGQERNKE